MKMTDPLFRRNTSPCKPDAFTMTHSLIVHCSLFQYLQMVCPVVFRKNTMKNPVSAKKPSGGKNVS
jgi:hypothetical protein